MGKYAHTELRGEQQNREILIDPTDARCVDLHKVHCARLKELFEHHAVVSVLASGDRHGRDSATDGGVSEHVIWTRGLLDPRQIEWRELLDPGNRDVHIPPLIRIHSHRDTRSNRLT